MSTTVIVNGQTFSVPNARVGELIAFLKSLGAANVTEMSRPHTTDNQGRHLISG